MERLDLTSTTPEQTRRLGIALGRAAAAGDVLLLEGPFGSGKTVLVQGLAAGLGVEGYVSSPSFIMINEHQGRLRLVHVDLYRVEGQLDGETLGALEEELGGDSVSAVEWPTLLPSELRAGATLIRFRPLGESARRIEIDTLAGHLAAAAREEGARTTDGRRPTTDEDEDERRGPGDEA